MSGQQALVEFLQQAAGNQCVVILSTGAEIAGVLCTIDGFFNVVLKDAVETVKQEETNKYPSVFIRGGKVVHIAIV